MSQTITKWIKDENVTKEKIHTNAAGDGLTKANAADPLNVGEGLGITVGATTVAVNRDAVGSTYVAPAINLDVTNGVGILIDAATIDVNGSDQLYVPNGGIGVDQIDSAIAGLGLSGGGGSAIDVNAGNGLAISVDDVIVKADVTGGTNLATVINVHANGVSIRIDDDTIKEGSDQLFVNKLLASFIQVSSFTPTNAQNYDSADTAVTAAAPVDTPQTTWGTAEGIYVDSSGDYGVAGVSLPATGSSVTHQGSPGAIPLRDSVTHDPIVDTNDNEVYGILFYNTNGVGAYYIKYFVDNAGTQIAHTWNTTTNPNDVDFMFGNIYSFSNLPNQALMGTPSQFIDVVAGDITSVTAGSGLTGGSTSGNATLDVGAGNGIVVTATTVAAKPDTTSAITTTAKAISVTAAGIGVYIDGVTIDENGSNQLFVPNGGITEDQLAASVAGDGLVGGAGNPIDVGAGDGITVNTDDVEVKPDTTTSDGNTAKVVIVAAAGVAVRVDDSTIYENGSNQLAVKDDGITQSHILWGLAQDGDNVNSSEVPVDSAYSPSYYTPSTSYDTTDALDSITNHLAGIDAALNGISTENKIVETVQLTAGMVTGGWIGPLSQTPIVFGDEIELTPIGGPDQQYGLDYTVDQVTGGSAAGYYLVTAATPTGVPGGGAWVGSTFPTTGIASNLAATTDYMKIAYEW